MVHREPHEHISGAEFQFVIDEFGGLESLSSGICQKNLHVTKLSVF